MLYKNSYCSNCNQTFSNCHDHGYPCGGEAVEVFQTVERTNTVYNRCHNCNRNCEGNCVGIYYNYNRCGHCR
jgi:hypothetical protein